MRRCGVTCLVHMQQLVSTSPVPHLGTTGQALPQRHISLCPFSFHGTLFTVHSLHVPVFPNADPSPSLPSPPSIPSYHPFASPLLRSLPGVRTQRNRPVLSAALQAPSLRSYLLRSCPPAPPFIIVPLFFFINNQKLSLSLFYSSIGAHAALLFLLCTTSTLTHPLSIIVM